MWPAMHTCPNISSSVEVLSQYCANLGLIQYNLIIQIFQYLAGTLDLGITFRADLTDELVKYTNSDWAGLKDRRRSTSRYTFFLLGKPESYQSKQQIVALSLIKVKHIAITEAGKEALWIV